MPDEIESRDAHQGEGQASSAWPGASRQIPQLTQRPLVELAQPTQKALFQEYLASSEPRFEPIHVV
jgi:hypothetical protein